MRKAMLVQPSQRGGESSLWPCNGGVTRVHSYFHRAAQAQREQDLLGKGTLLVRMGLWSRQWSGTLETSIQVPALPQTPFV